MLARWLPLAFLTLSACGGGSSEAPDDESTSPTDSASTDPTDRPQPTTPTEPEPDPEPVAVGHRLLFTQLSYSGAPPMGGTDHYFSDQFLELTNADDVPLIVDGLLLGEVYGVAGAINPGTQPDSFRDTRPDEVVMASVWRVPEGVTLQPGETLTIAHDGVNHVPFSTVDLSGADFETFVATSGGDENSPTVDNLDRVHFDGGYDWLITVFGPSLVILEPGTPLGDETGSYGWELKTAPAAAVLDAIECLMDADSGDFKRLPDSVVAGHTYVSGTYVGEAVHRVHDGIDWVDTDDASVDFVVGEPVPTLGDEVGVVTGDPVVALGTGVSAYEPLPDGATVELVAGPQGGWHVDVSVRAAGFEPDGVILTYDATLDGQPIAFTTRAQLSSASVLSDGDDGFDRVGDRLVLEIGSAAEVVGEQLQLTLMAELGGEVFADQALVTVVDED
jgi:hypothetical protein